LLINTGNRHTYISSASRVREGQCAKFILL